MTDRTSRCLAVNLYNVAPGKGVIIGDSVAIAEPIFKRVHVTHNGQVSLIQFLLKISCNEIIAMIFNSSTQNMTFIEAALKID